MIEHTPDNAPPPPPHPCGVWVKMRDDDVLRCRYKQVPHDCGNRNCQGRINLKKIEAFGKVWLAIPDPDKLELLADWIDKKHPNDSNPEVQRDLRMWAVLGRAALAQAEEVAGE